MSIGGVEFAVSRGKKLHMDKVRVPHYMEGALRMLREMVVDEQLPSDQIVHHLNYLIQIACFAQTKGWRKVLNYDTIYRREQHQHGFAWGSGSSFLMTSQLAQAEPQPPPVVQTPPTPSAATTTAEKPRWKQVIYPATGKPVCGKHNSREGCHLPSCGFEHVCKQCFSTEHTRQMHFSAEDTSEQPKN